MEQPTVDDQLLDIWRWIGWDRLLYASDYPHWDFDDPGQVLPIRLSDEHRRAFFFENARKLYRLP